MIKSGVFKHAKSGKRIRVWLLAGTKYGPLRQWGLAIVKNVTTEGAGTID